MTEIEKLKSLRDYHMEELRKVNRELDNIVFHMEKKYTPRTSEKTIIDGVCSYYGITREVLAQNCRIKGMVVRRKLTAYLLDNYSHCTQDKIAKLLGYKNHATVCIHLKNTKEELSGNYAGYEDMQKEYDQLLNYMKL